MMWKKASFTVEAAFIFSIAIWILFSICYLSMYVHDRTAVYSLGKIVCAKCFMGFRIDKGEEIGYENSIGSGAGGTNPAD